MKHSQTKPNERNNGDETTNYTDTLIEIAEDCHVLLAEEPPLKGGLKTIARMQYE